VFPGYTFASSSLVFVGPRVLILEIRIVFSWGFRTRVPRLHVCIVFTGFIGARVLVLETCIVLAVFFFGTRVPRLQVYIVFAGFVEARAPILEACITCFLTGRLYRLRWVFFRSTCSHIVFSGGFSEHLFSYLKLVSF